MKMMRKRGHNLEDSFANELDDDLVNDDPNLSLRQRLDHLLNSVVVHVTVLTLVLLDLLLVTSLLLIDQGIIIEPSEKPQTEEGVSLEVKTDTGNNRPSSTIQDVENGLHITQIVLLSVFIFKAVLRVLAKGSNFVYDKAQVFDSIVVLVTFSLYIALTGAVQSRTVTYCVGYLIVLRLWRFKRLYDCLVEPVRLRAEKIAVSHRKAWKHAEDQLKAAQAKLDSQQNEISILREQVSRLRRSSQTSPAVYRSHSQQATPDIREGKTVSVHADQTTPQHRKAANGSVPGSNSHTPRGSIGSHQTNSPSSGPGTPQSLSHIIMDIPENGSVAPRTDNSSNNFPDIVEDTHPFSVQNRDKAASANKAHTLPKTSLEHEGSNGIGNMATSDRYRKLSESHSEEQFVFDNRGYQSHESYNNGRQMAREHGRNVAVPDSGPVSGHDVEVTVEMPDETKDRYIQSKSVPNLITGEADVKAEDTRRMKGQNLPRPLVKGASESDLMKEAELRDKHHWRRASEKLSMKGKAATNVGYLNPSFGVSMTDEEFREIQRISQVPFDCDSSSEKDGIPMTDL